MNMTTQQARQFMQGLSGLGSFIDPIDSYPTDASGNALNIDTAFLTPAQIACLNGSGACSITVPAPLVRDPVTGQLLNPATGLPYAGATNMQTVLLFAAAAVIIYLLMRKK